jgi:hypothetical protein
MNESEILETILARFDELKSCIDQQEKEINEIMLRLEKLEKLRTLSKQNPCAGGCYSEDLALLEITDTFKPKPGEIYLKEGKAQAEYKKSIWRKLIK